jgi:hydroxymethylpyrimidine pyrophosphatase-like HAD family hydrolase
VQRAAEECVRQSDRVHWLDKGTEHPHRIALSVHKDKVQYVKDVVQAEVDRAGYQAQFIVSGSGDYQYLDILSIHGGKRKAMEYVRRIFGITPSRVVAAGDSGNDILMMEGVLLTASTLVAG